MAGLKPINVTLSVSYRFNPEDSYLDQCGIDGEKPTQEGFHAYVMGLLDNPRGFLPTSAADYTITTSEK